jgi:GDP/UDP-N,N'-diacetylbacillosamine 2-epimerase (hydrolysing)
LSPLLSDLKKHPLFKLELLVGGAHLLDAFGKTVSFIHEDGFDIAYKFPFLFTDEENDVLSRSLSILQYQAGEYFSNNKPDLLIILGDRVELIPIALSATLNNIPIAHISGGETTEGVIDNQIRHALTKFSHIHFPATDVYGDNIKLMGEEDWRICVTGEPGLDLIWENQYIEKKVLFQSLGLKQTAPVMLMTFHPETISNGINTLLIKEIILTVLNKGYQVLATASNFDKGGQAINRLYESMAKDTPSFFFHPSLGQKRYYSLLKYTSVLVGNSSSGLVEAQSFNIPVINVGERQKGRLINPNVISVPSNCTAVIEALDTAISEKFKEKYYNHSNIYGDGNACKKMISYLESVDWGKLIKKKDCFAKS